MTFLFYLFLIINAIAFILIGYDKNLAKKQKRRIPERRALKNIAYFDYHRFLDNKKTLVTGVI
ncbi:hypothetical protein FFWV33_04535 [Flavobacterium faecale]|uniref:Uncharacterized protein n=1 Tax=Flavobacterium faecale TaxID=1355330 RepID=A0A2S1LAV7_9FLAO|nr:DUF1294 domain-containing protein [Flavobacterium faecale]AWG20861.1 hypothetical protein FFWV33_04535 [Flavobacterium faecale]